MEYIAVATIREQIIQQTSFRLLRHLDYRNVDIPPTVTSIVACIEFVVRDRFVGDSAYRYYQNLSDASLTRLINAVRAQWKQDARFAASFTERSHSEDEDM